MKFYFTPKRLIIVGIIILISIFNMIQNGKFNFYENFIFPLFFILAYYALKYSTIGFTWSLAKVLGKNIVSSKKSITAVEKITNDETFQKELARVIKDEGDFNEFIKKIEAAGGDYEIELVIKNGFQKYKTPATVIVEKLLLTDLVQIYIVTNMLSKIDIQFIGDSLFTSITEEGFRKKSLEIRNKYYPELAEDEWGNPPKTATK